MFFQVNEATRVNDFGALSHPGMQLYSAVEVLMPCPVYHVHLTMTKPPGDDDTIADRYFLSPRLDTAAQLAQNNLVIRLSINIYQADDEGVPIVNRVEKIYQHETTSGIPFHICILDNGKKLEDITPVGGEFTGKKTCVFDHSQRNKDKD